MFIINSLISKSDNPSWEKVLQTRILLRDLYFAYWSKSNLFSYVWWLMLILFISLWFMWWRYADKSRLHEIITYGLMVSLVASVVDIVGCEYVLWGYPIDLLPLISPLIVTDFCMLPITYMLLYQYFVDWKSYTIATVVISAFLAFIAENIAVQLSIYQMNSWKHFYSFLMYILLALSLKWFINKIITIEKNCKY